MTFIDNIHHISLEIEESVIEKISTACKAAYPNELGGFLIGHYSSDMACAKVTQMIVPPKYEAGPTSFQRDTDGLNAFWDELFKKGLYYLGEWHSHPNGSAQYSNTDKNALSNIAKCDTVNIKNPIMVIFGYKEQKMIEIKAYYYRCEKIIEYNEYCGY